MQKCATSAFLDNTMRYDRACTVLAIILLAFALAACGEADRESDAFGNFEAAETVVSAESSGRLIDYRAREGERLAGGEIVAIVDTTQLVLQRGALQAQRAAAASRIQNVRAQLDVLEERERIADREQSRFENLVSRDAAPRRQLDEASDQLRLLQREAQTVRSQVTTIRSEMASVDAQIAQINEQITRSIIRNPVYGVVLTSFVEPHELAAPGRALYEIADLDTLFLRAYVSGGQLPDVRLGERVEVLVDDTGGEIRTLPGTVSWIASEAEFTPKLIQTREDRVDLVYAVRVRVPNEDGRLKIGMPGEVRFINGRAENRQDAR